MSSLSSIDWSYRKHLTVMWLHSQYNRSIIGRNGFVFNFFLRRVRKKLFGDVQVHPKCKYCTRGICLKLIFWYRIRVLVWNPSEILFKNASILRQYCTKNRKKRLSKNPRCARLGNSLYSTNLKRFLDTLSPLETEHDKLSPDEEVILHGLPMKETIKKR